MRQKKERNIRKEDENTEKQKKVCCLFVLKKCNITKNKMSIEKFIEKKGVKIDEKNRKIKRKDNWSK